MRLSIFQRRLDAHGADLSAWPAAERAAAEALLARSDAARRARDEAARLEALLRAETPRADARLRAAILAIPQEHAQVRPAPATAAAPRRWRPRWLPWAPAFAALAASAAVGFIVGTTTPADLLGEGQEIEIAALVYGPEIDGVTMP